MGTFKTWESGSEMLTDFVHMEEERYLRTVASWLTKAGLGVEVEAPHMGHDAWSLQFPDGGTNTSHMPHGSPDGPIKAFTTPTYHEFYVSSGGMDCEWTLQICDPGPDGKWETFIDLPWGRPVLCALKILDHYQQVVNK